MYLVNGRILALAILGFWCTGIFASDDYVIFQVRTPIIPGADFDEVRIHVVDDDGWTLDRTHPANPARDYGLGVRVFEERVGNNFDEFDYSDTYFATVGLYLGGSLVTERPVRFEDQHGHPHNDFTDFSIIVITVLLVPESYFITPVETVFKVPTLEVDADSSGTVSPGDVLRYTIPLFATHDIAARSTLTDVPDRYNSLIAGSVSTSHGIVRYGNLPADDYVEVWYDAIPEGDTASVSYLTRVSCPPGAGSLVNHAELDLRLSGSTFRYSVRSDDPATPQIGDPTVVGVNCPGQLPAPVPKQGLSLEPTEFPQFAAGSVEIAGNGFGTASGAPLVTVNGITVKGFIVRPQAQDGIEVIGAELEQGMLARAGPIPLTITPADPNLPVVEGLLPVRAAADSASAVDAELGEALRDYVDHVNAAALAAFEAARAHAHLDPASCRALQGDLANDLGVYLDLGIAAIERKREIARAQAVAVNAEPADLDAIDATAAVHAHLLAGLIGELDSNIGLKPGKSGKPRKKSKKHKRPGLVCPARQ